MFRFKHRIFLRGIFSEFEVVLQRLNYSKLIELVLKIGKFKLLRYNTVGKL